MSFVPKYQWLTEFKDLKCGGCDKVYLNTAADNKFQVRFTPTVLIDETFDGNATAMPMQLINAATGSGGGSGYTGVYGIVFDLDVAVQNHWVNSFSFFYNGIPYCYIFAIETKTWGGDYYKEIIDGSFHLIKIDKTNAYSNYANAFNIVIAQFGIICVPIGTPTMELVGFPEGTQVDHNPTSPISQGLCNGSSGCNVWNMNNFMPIDNECCFYQISALDFSTPPTLTPSIYKEFIVAANKRCVFTVQFTNSFVDPVNIDLNIRDEAFAIITTISKNALQGTNTLTFAYTTGFFPPSSYFFEFQVSAPIGTEIADASVGFCYNGIKIETINTLSEITIMNCDGNEPLETFTEEYNDLYSSLITAQFGDVSTGAFQIKLQDDEANFWTSIMYQYLPALDCTKRNYLNIKWWSDCVFGELEYSTLPFTNEVWIQGYGVSLPLTNKERIMNTLSTGGVEPVFNHSIEKREFDIGLYTETWYRTLQRAFEHKYIQIDDVNYKQDSDSVLTKKPENDSYFTAKIELYEVDTAVISSSCCC